VNGIDIPQVCHYFISEDAFNWAMSNFAHFILVTIAIFIPSFIFFFLLFRFSNFEKAVSKTFYLSLVVVAVFWLVNAVCLFRTCAY
jgi:hypothetical protein